MVDMRVGQEYCVDALGRYGEGDVFVDIDALLHTAVDQIISALVFQ